jgi:hypothetical protein
VPKFQAAIRDRAGVVPRLLPAVAVAWPMPLLQLCKRERRRSAEVVGFSKSTAISHIYSHGQLDDEDDDDDW